MNNKPGQLSLPDKEFNIDHRCFVPSWRRAFLSNPESHRRWVDFCDPGRPNRQMENQEAAFASNASCTVEGTIRADRGRAAKRSYAMARARIDCAAYQFDGFSRSR
jgi:hypothetical protein